LLQKWGALAKLLFIQQRTHSLADYAYGKLFQVTAKANFPAMVQ